MAAENNQVQKFIQILIKMAGVDESQKQSEKFYKTHHDGMGGAKKDSEEAAPKITEFLDRWKYELMLVGGAVAGIYGLIKYSSVAQTMTDLLGKSVGFLADIILISLLPVVIVLTEWILWLAKGFSELPPWIKDLIAWGIGLVVVLEGVALALKILGLSAATTGLILGALAGTAIGIIIVVELRNLGFFKAIGDMIGNAKAAFQNWLDDLEMNWDNMWINAFNFLVQKYNETLGSIPGVPKLATIENLDRYDVYQNQLQRQVDNMGGEYAGSAGSAGGRKGDGTANPGTPAADSQWADIVAQMKEMGLTPKEYVDLMRKNKIEPPKYEFVPPDKDWNPENNPLKDFLSWGYNYKDDEKTGASLPSTDLSGLETKYNDLIKKYPEYNPTYAPAPGASAAPQEKKISKDQVVTVSINNATFNLDPSDPANKSLIDQITTAANRSNSINSRRLNPYG